MTDTKTCEGPDCGATIVRAPRMSQQKWDIKRYCGRSCQAAANSLRYPPPPAETKPCALAGCDGVVTRQRGDGTVKWERRRYHTHECSAAARRGEWVPPPAPAPAAPAAPAVAPQRAVWRPAGWSATPRVGRAT